MGYAGGMTMCDLRRATISPYVSNAIPHNWTSVNIVVPLQLPDSTVAYSVPYYIGVRHQEQLAAVSPPHNSIPRRGSVMKGAKVLVKYFQSSDEDLPFLRAFTATVYFWSTNTAINSTTSPTSHQESKRRRVGTLN
jgi:hypothetical protein